MNFEKNPLTPHLQIYKWHISSLLSITHRIVGVINFFVLILICLWIFSFNINENRYFKSTLNKFWKVSYNFNFQLNEKKMDITILNLQR